MASEAASAGGGGGRVVLSKASSGGWKTVHWEEGRLHLGKLAIVALVPGENDQPESVHTTRKAFPQKIMREETENI